MIGLESTRPIRRATEIYNCIARHLGVRHVSAPEASRPSSAAVSLDAVATLPDDLRNDLRNALATLNVNTVADVNRRVSCRDPKVGAVLAERAERFAYTSILDALEGIQGDPVGEAL